jgi:hypothetical protein
MLSRQADAGNAAQKTTLANIVNAPFLLQFMMHRPRVLDVSIRRRRFRGSVPHHILEIQ